MKQHMEHCTGAAFVPRAMTCYLCDMQFASIAGNSHNYIIPCIFMFIKHLLKEIVCE